jgi:hypothetical protein
VFAFVSPICYYARMHGLPAELLDTVVKAIVGSLATWAISALFKKRIFGFRVLFAGGVIL